MRGADKLLRSVDGTPLILRQTRAALGALASVRVVLPAGDVQRAAWLSDLPVKITWVSERTLSASIKAGLGAAPEGPVVLLLADLPEIGAPEIAAVAATGGKFSTKICRGTAADGTPGHPVYLPAAYRDEMSRLLGDQGAQAIIAAHGFVPVPLPGRCAVTDLDTPEAWEAWEAQRPKR